MFPEDPDASFDSVTNESSQLNHNILNSPVPGTAAVAASTEAPMIKYTYTIKNPIPFQLDESFDGVLLKDGNEVFGTYGVSKGSADTGSLLTIQLYDNVFGDDGSKAYRKGFLEFTVVFSPSKNTGVEDLTFLVDGSNKEYTIYYKPKSIKPSIIVSEGACTCNAPGCYRFDVTVKPGNQYKNDELGLELRQSLKDLQLQLPGDSGNASHKITWGESGNTSEIQLGTEYSSDSGIALYTTSAAATSPEAVQNGVLSYKTPSFQTLIEDGTYTFSYSAKVNPGVYLRSAQSEVGTDSQLYSKSGDHYSSKVSLADSKTDWSLTIKPELIKKSYVYDPDNKVLHWTLALNSNYIAMSQANLYLNVEKRIGNKETYFETPQDIKINGSSLESRPGWTSTSGLITAENTKAYGYKFSYGTTSTVGTESEISTPYMLTFDTKIKDEFFQDNHNTFIFDVDVYLKWWYGPAPDDGTGAYGGGYEGEDMIRDEQTPSSSILTKKCITADPKTGLLTREITVNQNKIQLDSSQLTDTIAADQEFVSIGAVSGPALAEGVNYEVIHRQGTDSVVNVTLGSISGPCSYQIATKPKFDHFYQHDNVDFTNEVALKTTAGEKPVSETVSAKGTMPGGLIKKSAAYSRSAQEITWTITVNEQHHPLDSFTLSGSALNESGLQKPTGNSGGILRYTHVPSTSWYLSPTT